MTAHPELVRALAAVADSPEGAAVAPAIGLGEPPAAATHTEVFVIQTHPYASVHLGSEGMLGGEAADRVAGFWRTIGLTPPPDADHLSALLGLYVRLADERQLADSARRRSAIDRAAAVLLWEHVLSWALVHLEAVRSLGQPFYADWADLLEAALVTEAANAPEQFGLPAALEAAPPAVDPGHSAGALLDGILSPARSGMVLTRSDLARAGRAIGIGLRHGERRYALSAMLEQDAPSTVAWLGEMADGWAGRHRRLCDGPTAPIARWWAARAEETSDALLVLAGRSASAVAPR